MHVCQRPPLPKAAPQPANRTLMTASWTTSQGKYLSGMSGKSIELDRWLTYAGGAGQPGGKGWVRLSPRGVQEGQEVDPAQPPVPNPQRGIESRSGCRCVTYERPLMRFGLGVPRKREDVHGQG